VSYLRSSSANATDLVEDDVHVSVRRQLGVQGIEELEKRPSRPFRSKPFREIPSALATACTLPSWCAVLP